MNNPTIQIIRFSDGGFALHKVTGGGFASHFSAWFALDGTLLDAEQITGGMKISKPIKRDGPAWRYLARVGSLYVLSDLPPGLQNYALGIATVQS